MKEFGASPARGTVFLTTKASESVTLAELGDLISRHINIFLRTHFPTILSPCVDLKIPYTIILHTCRTLVKRRKRSLPIHVLKNRELNCARVRFANSARNFHGALIILMVPLSYMVNAVPSRAIYAPFDAETDYMKELIRRMDAEYGFCRASRMEQVWRAVEPRVAEARSVV